MPEVGFHDAICYRANHTMVITHILFLSIHITILHLGVTMKSNFKSLWGAALTLIVIALLAFNAYLLVINQLEYEKSSSSLDVNDDSSICTTSPWPTDYIDGNFELVEDDAIYEFSNKSVYIPYQFDTYLSNIRTNTTILYPQSEGFQFAVRLSDGKVFDPNQIFVEYHLTTKYSNGTKNTTILETEAWTSAHFSQSWNYTPEQVIPETSDDPFDGINLSTYTCAKRTDLGFYSNSYGVESQYLEIIQKSCDNTTSSTWVGSMAIFNNYKYAYMELLFVDGQITKYGNVLKNAITKYKTPSYYSEKTEYFFELTPHYVDPLGTTDPYMFYTLFRGENLDTYIVGTDRYAIRVELSNKITNHWRGEFSIQEITKTDQPVIVEEIQSTALMSTLYFVFYVISQIGGLMYFVKIVSSPVLNYFNLKISKHRLVNSWVQLKNHKFLGLTGKVRFKIFINCKHRIKLRKLCHLSLQNHTDWRML